MKEKEAFSAIKVRDWVEFAILKPSILNKNIWKGSLSQEGPRLFNTLPRPIRDLTNCT